MADPDDFLDVSLLNFEGDVDDQVTNLLEHIRLSRGDVVGLRNLLTDLERALRNVWPDCEVHPFGSIVTGLGIKSSDVDVYVKIPNTRYNKAIQCPVIVARNTLRCTPWIFTKTFAIPAAKVPIVKFLHVPTGCNCDVNFKSESGVANSKLIFHLLRTESKALSLAIIIKYWSKVFKFTGTNLLSNYALMMLVIFYLQGINMLAPVSHLQKFMRPYMVDGWNCAIDKDFQQPRGYDDNMYHLLGGFFKCYSFFRFDQYVVSTFVGRPILRSSFGGPGDLLDKEFSLYRENLKAEICDPLRIDTLLCIQDPFEHNRNCSVAVSKKLFSKIQMHFQYAARMYDEMPPDDFIKAVFNQDTQTHQVQGSPHILHVIQKTCKINKKKKKKKMTNTIKMVLEMRKNRKKL